MAAVAAAASLVLAGCSGGGGSSDSSGAQPKDLTLTAATAPISLNPALSNSGLAEIFLNVGYSSLVHATSDGKYEPALADSWEYVGSGNTDFKITLKDGVKFDDGTPLNAAAVKASLEYFKSAKGPFSATTNIIDSISTPDDRTVELKLNSPSPDLPFSFSEGGLWGAIISAKGIASPDSLGTSTAGAGPYMLDSKSTVANSSYVYVKNPNYFDKKQQRWGKVTINVVSDSNAALQSVTSGQSNWVAGTHDQVASAKGANLTVEEAVPNTVMMMISDRAGQIVPALGQDKVRQALNYAVDREAIAKVLGGKANQQIIAENRTGYSPDAAKVYSHDVAKAKQLLSEAGYPNGFEMSVLVGSYDPLGSKALEIMSDEYAKIGVQLKITTAPTFGDFARQSESGTFSSIVIPWGSTTMFTVAQQLVLPTGIVNPFHSSNEEFNTLFAKAAGEPAAQAETTWQQLSLKVTPAAWFVPVATVSTPFIGSSGIHPAGDGFTFPNPLHF